MDTTITMSGVTKRFGAVTALAGLDLTVGGGVYALLGPNGAGKTTAISIMLGLERPDAGAVCVLGCRPGRMSVRRSIGAMLQVGGVPGTLTVREHVEQFSGYYPAPLPFAQVRDIAGLRGIEDRRFDRLSGGQKQRVLFALAVCGDPQMLFLDEPTVGLDVDARRGMWRAIRALADAGRTIILTTHYLEEADALADRVGVLHGGRLLAEGTPEGIKARVGGRLVRCMTALDVRDLWSLPGVRTVRRRGSAVECVVDQAEPMLRALFARDACVSGLEVESMRLEDAFLSLTEGAA